MNIQEDDHHHHLYFLKFYYFHTFFLLFYIGFLPILMLYCLVYILLPKYYNLIPTHFLQLKYLLNVPIPMIARFDSVLIRTVICSFALIYYFFLNLLNYILFSANSCVGFAFSTPYISFNFAKWLDLRDLNDFDFRTCIVYSFFV